MDRRKGQPGKPGHPGSPGTATMGGKGGTGGEGGAGGTAEITHSLVAVIVFVTIVALALSVVSFVLVGKANTAVTHANKAIDEGRRADYRICQRQMVNRAVIDNQRLKDTDKDDTTQYLPLYDCTPDQYGGLPRRLSPAQSVAFRKLVASMPESSLP